ncbi:DUF1778 domain-containing protein [Pectobacterium brasiliense]|uniref:type II toxin-antitoxin system TacA family antitoxin n=1 Tax=Pectobacterium brasiliense TaxID=180957 RepID=UPI000B96E854|nr:DUF1778 domain-containing protein [Pectobacterium carotovorum]OYN52669.1 hypothetical protein B7L51_03960 [Pectobacterium carotovorum]OYN52672.1 hypothetical protein B7L51_03975 [Pectobacterium carotovorum]
MRNAKVTGGFSNTVIATKESRIELRTSSEMKEQLREAASVSGLDMSSFVLAAAAQAAKQVLDEQRLRFLINSEWEKMNEILNNPRQPGERLRDLMTRKVRYERQF